MPRFSVRTFTEAQLQQAAQALLAKAVADGAVDVIIGIQTGGYRVAQYAAQQVPQAVLLPITCRRASTDSKQQSAFFKNVLAKLPYAITNVLRIAEHIFLTSKHKSQPVLFAPDVAETHAIQEYLKINPCATILIIDDAVDSGATLKAVADCIRALAPDAQAVKTAVITVTTESPLLEPDISLNRYVLCRFPWSFDFHG